jgi:hypothetical protein
MDIRQYFNAPSKVAEAQPIALKDVVGFSSYPVVTLPSSQRKKEAPSKSVLPERTTRQVGGRAGVSKSRDKWRKKRSLVSLRAEEKDGDCTGFDDEVRSVDDSDDGSSLDDFVVDDSTSGEGDDLRDVSEEEEEEEEKEEASVKKKRRRIVESESESDAEDHVYSQ